MRKYRDLNGMAFTTKDQDHDQHGTTNCAVHHRGALWHNRCTWANLNGLYLGQTSTNNYKGMIWFRWKTSYQALKKSEMKIRLIEL